MRDGNWSCNGQSSRVIANDDVQIRVQWERGWRAQQAGLNSAWNEGPEEGIVPI
jgi:hypothetical protein